ITPPRYQSQRRQVAKESNAQDILLQHGVLASCNHLFSLPVPPRPFPRPELLVLLVVELVVQVVVLVEIVQVLLVQLVLVQLVVEVLVQVLVLFEVSELLVAETVAATLERPVRRLTGQHCHPQLGLRWLFERASPDSRSRYDSSTDRAFRASLRRSVAPSARLRSR